MRSAMQSLTSTAKLNSWVYKVSRHLDSRRFVRSNLDLALIAFSELLS